MSTQEMPRELVHESHSPQLEWNVWWSGLVVAFIEL